MESESDPFRFTLKKYKDNVTTSKFTKPTQKSPQHMLHQFNYVSFFNSFRANLTPTYFHTLFPTATHNSIPHSLYIYVYYSTFLPESLPHKSLSLSLSLSLTSSNPWLPLRNLGSGFWW